MQETIEKWFKDNFDKGMPFDKMPIQTPYFNTYPAWPNNTNELPIGFQCISVSISKKEFKVLRQLIIDV